MLACVGTDNLTRFDPFSRYQHVARRRVHAVVKRGLRLTTVPHSPESSSLVVSASCRFASTGAYCRRLTLPRGAHRTFRFAVAIGFEPDVPEHGPPGAGEFSGQVCFRGINLTAEGRSGSLCTGVRWGDS